MVECRMHLHSYVEGVTGDGWSMLQLGVGSAPFRKAKGLRQKTAHEKHVPTDRCLRKPWKHAAARC